MIGVFRLASFLLLLGCSSLALSSSNGWKTCDGCTAAQKLQCAASVGTDFHLRTGDFAWVYDFHTETTSKYYLQVTPPGTVIQGDRDERDSPSLSASEVTAIQVSLSPNDAYYSGVLAFFVNEIWRPQGAAFNYPSCTQGLFSIGAQEDSERLSEPGFDSEGALQSSSVIVHPIEIAPGAGQNSAYDVLGALAAASQLASANVGFLGLLGEVQNIFDGFVPISPINTETQLKLLFSDGSYGIWTFNFQSDQWEADWSTFRDSEGNPMPLTPSDFVGQRYDFSGTDGGQNNLRRFLDRVRILGIPITGPGGGGGDSVPTQCRMIGDTMRCWPIGPY